MTDNELLQAISGMIDSKLQPVIKNMTSMQENAATTQKTITSVQENAVSMQNSITSVQENAAATQKTITSMQKNMATMQDTMATKADVKEVFNELMKAEKWFFDLDEKNKALTAKVDTLLLKSDNTSLLLQLINKQATELETVRVRVDKIEKKIS